MAPLSLSGDGLSGRCPTTVRRAGVPGGYGAEREPGSARLQALPHQVDDHLDELGVHTRRGGAYEVEAELLSRLRGLVVQVPCDLEVVRDETDRADHDTRHAFLGEAGEVVVDVRGQPRHLRRT